MADLKTTKEERARWRKERVAYLGIAILGRALDDLDTLEAENAALRAKVERLEAAADMAARGALAMRHLYGSYQVSSRGPVGYIRSILRHCAPEVDKRIEAGEDWDVVYEQEYGE